MLKCIALIEPLYGDKKNKLHANELKIAKPLYGDIISSFLITTSIFVNTALHGDRMNTALILDQNSVLIEPYMGIKLSLIQNLNGKSDRAHILG